MELYEKHLSTEKIFDGKIVHLQVDQVELPNGKQTFREVILHSGGVCIVPLTQDHEVYMVRQFRYPHHQTLLEIPAGKTEIGEDPLECGIRELKEEIGAVADEYIDLGKMLPTPAYDSECISMYLAQGLVFGPQHLDEDEFLEIEKIKLDELVSMVMRNEITDAKTQVAILKTHYLINQKQER